MRLVASVHVTLDGIMGSPEEWLSSSVEEEGERHGRRTASCRCPVDGARQLRGVRRLLADLDRPGGRRMNALPKYVVSATLKEPHWNNSSVISGDVAKEVAELKRQPGGDILLLGQCRPRQPPRAHGLITSIGSGSIRSSKDEASATSTPAKRRSCNSPTPRPWARAASCSPTSRGRRRPPTNPESSACPVSSKRVGGRRRATLALLAFAMLIVSLDQFIVVVALPEIGRELEFTPQTLQAVISAYAVASAGFLLLGGRASDLPGAGVCSSPACPCTPARIAGRAGVRAGGAAGRPHRAGPGWGAGVPVHALTGQHDPRRGPRAAPAQWPSGAAPGRPGW